jgi:hypothetical protein
LILHGAVSKYTEGRQKGLIVLEEILGGEGLPYSSALKKLKNPSECFNAGLFAPNLILSFALNQARPAYIE